MLTGPHRRCRPGHGGPPPRGPVKLGPRPSPSPPAPRGARPAGAVQMPPLIGSCLPARPRSLISETEAARLIGTPAGARVPQGGWGGGRRGEEMRHRFRPQARSRTHGLQAQTVRGSVHSRPRDPGGEHARMSIINHRLVRVFGRTGENGVSQPLQSGWKPGGEGSPGAETRAHRDSGRASPDPLLPSFHPPQNDILRV